MKLKPLQQWICDTCGQLIEKPEDGWVEWLHDLQNDKMSEFRICHHVTAQGHSEGCQQHDGKPGDAGSHLEPFLGPDGMMQFLSFVHVGPWHDFKGKCPIRLLDHVSWTDVFRRLHVPRYEEARQYFAQARSDGLLQGANEVLPYMESSLGGIISRYSV